MQLAGQLGEVQPVARGRSYLLLADVFKEIGDAERAQELYEFAVSTLEEQPRSKHLVTAYQRLAELMKAKGRPDVALELLERALSVQNAPAAVPQQSA
jgi:tetratricopeptide (TPR) repeat protein